LSARLAELCESFALGDTLVNLKTGFGDQGAGQFSAIPHSGSREQPQAAGFFDRLVDLCSQQFDGSPTTVETFSS